uniref:Abortive infection protein n=1 Tax=Chlorobium phaeobacteroides (strain BS1) TaxID=331678 RepID=B3EJA0_CHLPB
MKIFTYWFIAIAVGLVFFRKETFSYNTNFDLRRKILLAASVVIVAFNAFVYSSSTFDGGRSLDLASVVLFTVGNGIAETFMFYAFFVLGEKLMGLLTKNPWALFIAGFVCFMIYSGFIHALFWLDLLPEHVNQASPLKPLFMPTQILIAGSWALSFFWYRDLPSVFVLHGLVDLTMALNVKFSLLG